MNRLRASFAPYWQSGHRRACAVHLEHVLGPLTAKQQQLVRTLTRSSLERWIPGHSFRVPGIPPNCGKPRRSRGPSWAKAV